MQRNRVKVKQSMRRPFQSLQELIQHFENRLSILEIENVIQETGQLFICRAAITDDEERNRFIQRCYEALQGSLLLREEELVGNMPKAKA